MRLRLRRYALRHGRKPTCHACRRVDLEKSLDEGFSFGRKRRPVAARIRNLELAFGRLRGVGELRRQRVAAGEQEVGDDAQRPHVAGLAVAAALVVLHVDLGSEVDQLDLGVGRRVGEHDVAQLQVAMGNVLVVVEIGDGVQNLSDYLTGVVLGKLVIYGERIP